MSADSMPFADNWAYLKAELSWLDRLLMLAIARQRKETKAVNQVAKTAADRVSAHWWKGIISVSNPAYDDCRVPASPPPDSPQNTSSQCKPLGYQQQLERRIQASAKVQIVLALPSLRHCLNLTLFEKNLILMALAPEVNRRYGRLYHFLQTGEDSATASDLPTVDLALRLLCRNDLERRRAQAKLAGLGSLIERQIIRYVSPKPSTRLNSYLQLSDDWVNFLLAEQPDQRVIFERLIKPTKPVLALSAPTAATRAVQIIQADVTWDRLVLPAPLLSQLQTLGQQASAGLLAQSITQHSTTQPLVTQPARGQAAMLVGLAGTGKTMAAITLATSLHQPLCLLDLKQVNPEDWQEVIASLDASRYPVLLVKSAPVWLSRSSSFLSSQLTQWLHHRQTSACLTLLSCRYLHTVKAHWRQQMDSILTLPLPHRAARALLWRQAFTDISCSSKIDWVLLAKRQLAGGDITRVAQNAVAIAQSKKSKTVNSSHIDQALNQRGYLGH